MGPFATSAPSSSASAAVNAGSVSTSRPRGRGRSTRTSRTTAAGRERMVNLVMQVPGGWTVDRAHDRADEVEVGVAEALGGAETIVHVEPLGHPTRTGPMTV